MAAPLVGRRVRIDGLASKPELNGTEGTAVAFDDSKGRYNVKLDANNSFMSLKPANLTAADGGAGAPGSGMPGFGGVPGMGGMPGMGGRGAMGMLLQQLMAKYFAGGAPNLPAGLTPAHLGGGAFLVLFVLPRLLGIGMMQSALLGGLGGFTLLGAAGGNGASGVVANGRKVVRGFGGLVSRASGRPVSDAQAALFMAAAVFLLWKYVLSSGSGSGGGIFGGGGASDDSSDAYAAYTKGYNDGKRNKEFAPISDAPAGNSAGGSSKWGIGSLFNMMSA